MSVTKAGSNQDVLQQIGTIEDLHSLTGILGLGAQISFSSSKSSLLSTPTEQKDATTAIGISEDEAGSTDEAERQRKLWTKNVLVDISCDGRFMVLASEKEITVLSNKWKSDKQVFSKFWNGSLAEETGSTEVLTCCITLPLTSRHRSSDGVPDWTCIVYGFRSGFVAFHTETGYTVHRQQFDIGSVVQIKFVSPPSLSFSGKISTQELVILYDNGIVIVINGPELYHSLQSFKNCAADAVSRKRAEDEDVETRSINHEKFQLETQQTIHDIASLGSSQINGFDQLLNASILGGRSASVKMPLPSFRRIVAVGGYPLVSSYFIMEGETGLELGEVAKAVASKVSSVVTSKINSAASRFGLQGFLNRAMPSTKPAEKKNKVLPKSAKDVNPRFSIFDDRRCASSIFLSGSHRLAAMTDYFGRVLLLDCTSGLIVKMWKGYRSAEVAWITLSGTGSDKKTLFVECLIIYAPRRHLLEVWSALSGRRLVALHVSQGLRLVPISPHPLHLNSPSGDQSCVATSSCYFLDISGNIYSLNIPFYLVEEGANVEDARDAQAFHKLKENIFGSVEKLRSYLDEVISPAMKDQAVELILRNPECLLEIDDLCEILETQIATFSSEPQEEEWRAFTKKWQALLAYLRWYQRIIVSWKRLSQQSSRCSLLDETFVKKLNEISESVGFPLLTSVASARKPSGSEIKVIDWRTFVDLCQSALHQDSHGVITVIQDEGNSLESFDFLRILFEAYFLGKIATSGDFQDVFGFLEKNEVYSLLVRFWLSEKFDLSGDLRGKLELLQSFLSTLFGIQVPEALPETRLLIENTRNLPAALTFSFVIITTFLPRSNLDQQVEAQSDEWESICKESVEWTRLSQRIESLLSLQGFLVRFMPVTKSLVDANQLSVREFISRGSCAAAEYLASWTSNGFLDLPPTAIMKSFYSSDIEIRLPSLESEEKDDRPLRFLNTQELLFDQKEITEALSVLKAIFPKSLHPDVLLAECAWASVVNWSKNPQEVAVLNTAVMYLKDIVDGPIVHGLSFLMWKTFLAERVSQFANLLEKVGKVPKERLFTRDMNMNESAVSAFLVLTHKLLGYMLDADTTSTANTFAPQHDFLWLEAETTVRTSVVELSILQPLTTAPLLKHHLVLLDILRAIMEFNLKNVKPLSLFDFKGKEAFFQDLTSHPLLSVMEVDQTVLQNRTQFLSRAFSAVVRTASELCIQPDVEWVERLLEIATYWEISGDETRSMYVMELFSHGMDEIGEGVFGAITDKNPVLKPLLTLVGQRLALLTTSTTSQTDYARNLSTMTPKMVSWIRSMDFSSLANQNADGQSTYHLVRNIVHVMKKHDPDYKLCLEVFEWMQSTVVNS